jgi:hypothetical protein
MPNDDGLPDFEEGKIYVLSGRVLKALEDAVRANRPRASTGGGLTTSEQGPDGTFLAVSAGS